ncbi:hypothetical protein ACLMJK_007128 [Lecanora helva]
MGSLAVRSIYSGGCSANPSNLEFGPRASKYAVGCLPDVKFELPASWAGQIPLSNTTNDELFFWLFEAEHQDQSDNLIIWLNGGPGCSSLDGLTKENGPLHFPADSSTPSANPYSWTKLANVLYIDQPVGTGYSGGSDEATLNSQVTQDFSAWLGAFYDVFTGLSSKNTYIMGESYAGIYIPYFTQALMQNDHNLSVNIKAISIGDGTFGNGAALTDVGTTTYLVEQANILHISSEIVDVFKKADRDCGFAKALRQASYPPKGKIKIPNDPEGNNFRARSKRQSTGNNGCLPNPDTAALVSKSIKTCNKSPGQCSACATYDTALNYLNSTRQCFNPYNILYNCTNTPTITPFVTYLNKPAVRIAIHAPNKTYADCNSTILDTLTQEFVIPPAYSIMPALIDRGIKIHVYSGNFDLDLNHQGAELVLQNMTWGGKQGFQKKPKNKFLVDGLNAGNWGFERNLSYHRILHAGHVVPYDNPAAAFAYVKDFVVGDTGYHKS